jgi:hypothetical protein
LETELRRVYIAVECSRARDGSETPSVIYWPDGRFWKIDRVLFVSKTGGGSYEGIRYTVIIGGAEKYIYRNDRGWYVIPVTNGGHMNAENAVKHRSG